MRPLTLLCALLLTLAACGGADDSVDVTDGGVGDGEAMAATPPEGTWVLTDSTPDIGVPDGARASLRLEVTDGRTLSAGGDTPCNGFGGTATTTVDGGWEWQLDAITEMGCEPARAAAQDAYVEALAAAHTFRLDSGDLLLTGDEVELRFALQEPVEASGLVGTDWVLTGFVDGDSVSSISWAAEVRDATLRLDGDPEDGGTFTLFSGCRDFDGEWVTDGDTVRWPSWGQSDDSRDAEDCNASEVEAEGMVLAAVEGGFTVELRTQDVGSFLTVRSASDGTTGLTFRGPQAGEDGEASAGAGDPLPEDEDLAFTGPRDGEECYGIMAMSEDGDGAATPDAAMEELVTTGGGWWDPPAGVTHVGTTIVFEGRAVGEAELFEFRNGTWAISGLTVCYPPGSPLEQG